MRGDSLRVDLEQREESRVPVAKRAPTSAFMATSSDQGLNSRVHHCARETRIEWRGDVYDRDGVAR